MQDLLHHAQTLLNNPSATLKELNEVYICLTGTTCRTISKIRYKLTEFTQHPERFERRVLQYQQDKAEQMAEKKYRFSAEYVRKGEPNIILHGALPILVKKDQLTDEKAALLAAHPQYHVYVELIAPVKAEESPVTADVVAPKKKKRAPKKSV
jgi:hypothetical protein